MFHTAAIAPLGNEDSTVIKCSLPIALEAIAEPLHFWLIISGPYTEDSVIYWKFSDFSDLNLKSQLEDYKWCDIWQNGKVIDRINKSGCS